MGRIEWTRTNGKTHRVVVTETVAVSPLKFLAQLAMNRQTAPTIAPEDRNRLCPPAHLEPK